ncbi:unnamed protein product [Mucor hiemalis]
MAADNDRVELETSDLLQLRKDFRDLVNSMVDSNTHHEDDRKASKKELDGWLNRLWSDFANNVKLTDNPDFNFSEPITIEPPIDETLQYEIKKGEHDLQTLTEQLLQVRKETAHTFKSIATEFVKEESEPVNKLKLMEETPLRHKNLATVDLQVTKEVEPVYGDTMALLSELETKVPIVATDIEQFLPTAQDVKSLY